MAGRCDTWRVMRRGPGLHAQPLALQRPRERSEHERDHNNKRVEAEGEHVGPARGVAHQRGLEDALPTPTAQRDADGCGETMARA